MSNSWVVHGSRTATGRPLLANDPLRRWTTADALETYNIPRWGCGYFGVNEQGNLIVTPRGMHETPETTGKARVETAS